MIAILFRERFPRLLTCFFLCLTCCSISISAQEKNEIEKANILLKENEHLKEELHRLNYSNAIMEENIRQQSVETINYKNTNDNGLIFIVAIASAVITLLLAKYKLVISWIKKLIKPDKRENIETENRISEKKLTERELDVLFQLSKFKSNPEIADSLFISTNTAKTHVASILKKLKASNRQEAVHKATCLKLIPKQVEHVSLVVTLFLLVNFLLGSTTEAYTQNIELANTSNCTYLVKVNVLEESNCRLNGKGALVKLLPDSKINLPDLPLKSWIVAYGVEEVKKDKVLTPVLIGRRECNFRSYTEKYGTCDVKLEYKNQNLLISEVD